MRLMQIVAGVTDLAQGFEEIQTDNVTLEADNERLRDLLEKERVAYSNRIERLQTDIDEASDALEAAGFTEGTLFDRVGRAVRFRDLLAGCVTESREQYHQLQAAHETLHAANDVLAKKCDELEAELRQIKALNNAAYLALRNAGVECTDIAAGIARLADERDTIREPDQYVGIVEGKMRAKAATQECRHHRPVQLTHKGSSTMFNGQKFWVYRAPCFGRYFIHKQAAKGGMGSMARFDPDADPDIDALNITPGTCDGPFIWDAQGIHRAPELRPCKIGSDCDGMCLVNAVTGEFVVGLIELSGGTPCRNTNAKHAAERKGYDVSHLKFDDQGRIILD